MADRDNGPIGLTQGPTRYLMSRDGGITFKYHSDDPIEHGYGGGGCSEPGTPGSGGRGESIQWHGGGCYVAGALCSGMTLTCGCQVITTAPLRIDRACERHGAILAEQLLKVIAVVHYGDDDEAGR